MKKMYFVAAILLLTLTNCQKKDKVGADAETEVVTANESDSLSTEKVAVDSTTANTETSNVESLDEMSVKTKTITTDPSEGKFSLSETRWKLVELDGKMVENTSKEDFYINLDSKSAKFVAFVGCNKVTGAYTMKASDMLAFSKVMSTKKSCPNLDFETKFIKSLEKVDNYTIEDNSLHLKKGKRSHLAKFIAIK